ncbi:alpha/beta hydrolase [Mucilaginibacter sp.]|jgi:acetyl esterase/lipase|uniref:alpha/beta hydrolase n=1 Tax=Mucilaginibacter sp. TaxID=1882438 RepID=UPI0035664EB8
MVKQQLFLVAFLSITFTAMAQSVKPVKFKDLVFDNITKTKDLSYSDNSANKEKSHLFDLYQPAGDSSTGRPMIIWMHGGGFKFGSKNATGIELWSETFAKRGYVCAAINYSLSKNNPIFHFDELLKSTYYAVQDARAAVTYFQKNYKLYNIDPDKIILAGNSAGGMIALQAAYSSNAELSKLAGLPDTVTGAKSTQILKVAGVINYWGGIFDLNWLKNSHVPIVTIHGGSDGIVPLTHKDAPLYGSLSIHERADELKIPNGFKIFDGYSHELQKHFNPIFGVSGKTKERWLQAGQYTANFLYATVLK